MLISVTKINAPKEHLERMAQAFRQAAPDLKAVPGCTGFELWLNDTTLEAISRWESRAALDAYAQSGMFTAHHGGPGGGSGGQGAGAGGVEYYEGEVLLS